MSSTLDTSLKLFFAQDDFPASDLASILDGFGSVESVVRERDLSSAQFSREFVHVVCRIARNGTSHYVTVSRVPLTETERPAFMRDAKWSVSLYAETSAGAVWVARVIAYTLLSLIPTSVLWRPADDWFFRDAAAWYEYLNRFDLWTFELEDLGFADENGRLLI